jgi:hypothetical protein
MSYSTFKEMENRISPFLRFAEQKGMLASHSEESKMPKPDMPQLSYLRIELDRLRPGMADYIVRVSTPLYEGVDKSNTVLSIRGNRSLAKFEAVKKLADVIGKEMIEREDATHDWENFDSEHLADLIANFLKFFALTANADRLQFTTEALS